MKFRSHISEALAASIISLFLLVPAASAQQPATRRYTTKFEVTIKRASVLQAPYQVIGELAMDVAADGSFSCEIAPLKGLPDLSDPPSVVFTAGKFDPDGPAKLPCGGQVMGRLIGIMIDMGDNYKIFGTGVLPADFSRLPPDPILTAFGGTAATSVAGESGDWVTLTVCYTIPKFTNPITGTKYPAQEICVSVIL